MKESLLDSIVYRNMFDITELLLDLCNINIGNAEKRNRIKQAFLMITRRQKNRVITGFLQINNTKRLDFLTGCFRENTDLLKKRVAIIEDLSEDLRTKICEETDKYTNEVIAKVESIWKEKGLDLLTETQMKEEISCWKSWK